MRIPRHLWVWITVAAIGAALLWVRLSPRQHINPAPAKTIGDLSITSPLNQPGGGIAPAEAYEIYSALYQQPMPEPLVFAEDSMTDIPQVNGSCLKPSSPLEREMADAFVTANQQSHRWEQHFTIPQGYRLLPRNQVSEAQGCLETHSQDAGKCESYRQLRHLRFLGTPGVDHTHTHALVSVVKKCGSVCGSGGIFAVVKTDGAWQRAETTEFTRECSWMY
jgi:hypothetical protein